MDKTQRIEENISTYNTSSFNMLSNFISKILTKTKEQESISNNSEMEVATNIAENIFDTTNGNLGTSKQYFRNVIDIFRNIYKEPIISTTDKINITNQNNISQVETLKEQQQSNKENVTNQEFVIDFNNPLQEVTDCINNPEKCM